jgi:hypothetical protein
MWNRLVSLSSLLVVIASAVLFAVAAAALMADRVGQVDGIIQLNASVLAAVVFAQVYREPAWLEPVSIITSR